MKRGKRNFLNESSVISTEGNQPMPTAGKSEREKPSKRGNRFNSVLEPLKEPNPNKLS
jgi:hypothetical protein